MGLKQKEMKQFTELCIKAENQQLDLMLNHILDKKHERIQQRRQKQWQE